MFVAALAMWCAMGGPAQEGVKLLRYPAVSGDRVVFTYAADLWSWIRGEAEARRLTTGLDREFRARISPDGKWIAFTGNYDGNPDVYVIPAQGGEPKRLTFEPETDVVCGWTPDGRVAFTSNAGSDNGERPRLWLVDPKGGLPKSTPISEAADVSFSPDGKQVVFVRGSAAQQNWRRYRGGRQGKISIYDLQTNHYSELPSGPENRFSPMWVGNGIFFLSDRDEGTLNLFRYDLGSKAVTRLTDYKDGDIKSPATDGKTIVFERDTTLHSYDLVTKQVTELNPQIHAEHLASRPVLRDLSQQIDALSISPSGVRVALGARGEVFSVPAGRGDTRNLTRSSGARDISPAWSPDGKSIAYASDKTGEAEIYVQPQDGGAPVQLTHGQGTAVRSIVWSPDSKRIAFTTRDGALQYVSVPDGVVRRVVKSELGDIGSFSWSPDSRWIAYIDTVANGYGAVFLFDSQTGEKHQVTDGSYRDDSVEFDRAGRYLYLISARSVEPSESAGEINVSTDTLRQGLYAMLLSRDTPNPVTAASEEEGATPPKPPSEPNRIDLEGLGDRVVLLAKPSGGIPGMAAGKNKVYALTGEGVYEYVPGRPGRRLIEGSVNTVDLSFSGDKMAYLQNGAISILDVTSGASSRVNTSDVKTVISPPEEWKQMFWEAWRYERDNFYDPKMRGLDWNAVGRRYAAYLPHVHHRMDLTYVLGLMLAELSTSHSYVTDGDPWLNGPRVAIGSLGADYAVDSGHIRFARIYRGTSFDPETMGPLGEPGVNVKEGDYLLEIDGSPLDASTPPGSLLLDRAGKYVTLTVNDRPTMEGARKVRVRAIGGDRSLRYYEWTERNRRYVEKASGGKVGYMHITDTHIPGSIGFVRGYYRNSDKQALIVDERFNHGGYDPTFFIERLQREYNTALRSRHQADTFYPWQTVMGPKAMLINGAAGSGGDLFPWLFQTYKLGPLVGTRTWGGVVGIAGFYNLVDGGQVSAPEFRWYDPIKGDWILENQGALPDIPVDDRPDLLYQGKQPQLDAAIAYLLKELAKPDRRQIKKVGSPN
jgi:tricorn protease